VTTSVRIGDRLVGKNHPPFIVAELSGNHNGSLERALLLVDAAKKAGVDAIKLQTYTPDTMTLNISTGDFLIDDPKSLWCGKTLYDLYQEAQTPWQWHKPLFERCKKLGLLAFSTPFDASAVDFLESLDVPCYKIASLEIVDHPLIEKVAKTQKPLILSTGASSLAEIDEAVRVAKKAGAKEIILLKCTSAYPAPVDTLNLRTLPHLEKTFDVPVGISDHTHGIGAPIASIALGSCLIEKHLCLSRKEGGVDAAFSLEPEEFAHLVKECHTASLALGKIEYGEQGVEKTTHSHRRSLYFVKDIKKGSTITDEHIRAIRPGNGLSPKFYHTVLGAVAPFDIAQGTPVSFELLLQKKSDT
jgi:pseudaminic acid synthase